MLILEIVAKFYKSTDAFKCISNPSVKLSISQVNDDYCDCPDGSDEPGTSACSYLSPLSPSSPSNIAIKDINTTLALPGFYCKNKGHQPSYVPFLSVNDGVCDYDLCCDGSDEWEHVGGISCPDKCKEIGKEWKKQDEQRQKSLGAAAKKRKELVKEAQRLRKEVQDQIQNLQTQVGATEVKVQDLEKSLEDIERRERGKVVKTAGKGNPITILAGLAKDRVDELRQGLIDVRAQKEAYRARIEELEGILITFKEEYNPNFNDEGVKRAVKSWEDYAARDTPEDMDAARDRDLDEMAKPDHETGVINWSEWEVTEDSDVDLRTQSYSSLSLPDTDNNLVYKFEEYLPKSLRDWVDQKLRDLRVILVDNGILASSREPGSETKVVLDARAALKSAQDDLENNKKSLSNHQEDLEKNFGPDDVFRALKGQCISKDSGEYTYELCWLDRTTQKPKKGGSHTGMGNFARIDSITVDDDLPPDGKGVGSGERVILRYENGQHCWNGPNRSTMIVLACAEKDEIWKIVEEEKCVYRMEVGTPAVCGAGMEGIGKGSTGGQKDEL